MRPDQVEKMLRGAKLRCTQQRVALARELFCGDDRHVTAETIFANLVKKQVPISLATVYNTLRQFTMVGLLRKVYTDASRVYFDTNTTPHHHFVGESSGEIFDISEGHISVTCRRDPPIGTDILGIDVIIHLRQARPRAPS
jgi:Fur family transcriptional regulator, iron response regulator